MKDKIRPIRIFKDKNGNYVIIKGNKIYLDKLSKIIQNRVMKTKIYKTKKPKIALSREKVGKVYGRVVRARRSRPPKNEQEMENLKSEIARLKAQIRTNTEKELDSEKEKNKKLIEDIHQKENQLAILNGVQEPLKRIRLLSQQPQKQIEPQAPKPQAEEEKEPKELVISKREGELAKNIVTLEDVTKSWRDDDSGKKSFIDMQKIGIIPKDLKYEGTKTMKGDLVTSTVGWARFLKQEGALEKDNPTLHDISKARRQWVSSNSQWIYKKIEDYLKQHGSMGSGESGKGVDLDKQGQLVSNKLDYGLYDYQLDQIMEGLPSFYGSIDYHLLDNVLDKIKHNFDNYPVHSFILLIKGEKYIDGHWVCVFIDKRAMYVGYYNSFGYDAPDELKLKIKNMFNEMKVEHLMKWKYNKVQIQPEESSLCGLYCCHTLYLLYFGHSWKDSTNYKDSDLDAQLGQARENFGFI